jgi:hypothetical protein
MRCFLLAAAVAAPMLAHMVSISNGELKIEGSTARFEMRIPLYEVAHVANPELDLVAALRFRAAGEDGKRAESRCREDVDDGVLVCEARYEFPAEVEAIEAASTLHQITVPNHVHLLRATRGEARDQAVLDLSFPRAELRFRPPSAFDVAARQIVSGALRALGGPAQWLFLVALAIASRTRRELVLLAAMFLAGEAVSAIVLPLSGWSPEPRFVEVACALTIAYLAVEILWLAEAGKRWAVIAVLGLFHGLYLGIYVAGSESHVGWVLAGAFAAEVAILVALAFVLSRLARSLALLRPERLASWALLATGLTWFFLRLRA